MLVEAMQAAIASASEGVQNGEGGPFGAAIVKDQKILVSSHNTVLLSHDPTCHAEMNAIRAASSMLGNHVLDQCELYTTAEPCPMCMSAIMWAKVQI